ncbi:chaperonin 10-like protein [Dioszegia hungarica]|uniref:Chaperonin 10-like protein n=1 Tax=Dioszegia hungarica TaxID=4972 RepID=A0AA38LYJ4_9TREE|nr:chaperonin 10-like protein [Dioszegia hungarica]KAI9639059.1 chaperonin 10-like protein [Dioszegia hungarica]
MSDIRVARLPAVGKPFYTDKITKPAPGVNDVLVKVTACSIVPNTKNLVSNPNPLEGMSLPEFPCIFGLDVSGTVEAVGEHVLGIKPGDRVYVDPFLTCGTCQACRQALHVWLTSRPVHPRLLPGRCSAWLFRAPPRGQAYAQAVPDRRSVGIPPFPDTNIALIPDNIDLRLAARFGYLGTSFAGLKKGGMGPGKTLLVNGVTGTLGYAAVSIAIGLGCTRILGIGRNPDKLKQLSEFGNGRVKVVSSEEEKDIAGWVKSHTDGLGVDAMYDCLGNGGDGNMTMELIKLVKVGGKAILAAGGAEGSLNQTYTEAMSHSCAILGTMWFTSAEVDEMIALISAGVIDLSYMEHKSFSLDQVNEAMDFVGDRPGGAVNVIIQPGS